MIYDQKLSVVVNAHVNSYLMTALLTTMTAEVTLTCEVPRQLELRMRSFFSMRVAAYSIIFRSLGRDCLRLKLPCHEPGPEIFLRTGSSGARIKVISTRTINNLSDLRDAVSGIASIYGHDIFFHYQRANRGETTDCKQKARP